MCAIYGSFNKSMYEILHGVNQVRGTWGGSCTGIYDIQNASPNSKKYDNISKYYSIRKWEGEQKNISKILKGDNFDIYLGHLQAPTGPNRVWNDKTTHPFVVGDWVVAHNGVITNQDSLIKKYNNGVNVTVDSRLIPLIADKMSSIKDDSDSAILSIEKALSKLEGTFAIWAYNIKYKSIYIARQGSTLYADDKGNFSSINSKNEWDEVREGKIFQLTPRGLVLSGQFANKSPFFV